MSVGRSLGNATIAAAPAAATDLSPPPPTVSHLRTNGLRLSVWPQLVNGLTGETGNFTIRIADPACDPEDGCVGIGDEPPRPIEIFFHEVSGKYLSFHTDRETIDANPEGHTSVFVDFYPGRAAQENVTIYFVSSMLGFHDIKFYTLEEAAGPDSDSEENKVRATTATAAAAMRRSCFSNAPVVMTTIGRGEVGTLFYINMCVSGLLVVALFFMGIEIDLGVVKSVLKRPIGPAIGFVSQFVFMPLAAWGIGALFLTEDFEKLGLILVGSAPGGNLSNFWTSMLGGDVNLSVTMTMISSISSFGMTSLWVRILATQFSGERHIQIPYGMIALSLAAFIAPLCVGCLFKHRRREQAKRILDRFAKPYFLVCLVIVPACALITNTYYFSVVTWRHLLSGLLVGGLGYLTGATLAFLCRQGKPQIVAISLETAIQNTGMAYFILSLSFPSPLAEIGLVPVISFFFCSTGPILLVVYAFYEAYKRLFLPSPPTKQLPLPAAEKAEALVHSPAEAEKMAVQYYRDVVRSAV